MALQNKVQTEHERLELEARLRSADAMQATCDELRQQLQQAQDVNVAVIQQKAKEAYDNCQAQFSKERAGLLVRPS